MRLCDFIVLYFSTVGKNKSLSICILSNLSSRLLLITSWKEIYLRMNIATCETQKCLRLKKPCSSPPRDDFKSPVLRAEVLLAFLRCCGAGYRIGCRAATC